MHVSYHDVNALNKFGTLCTLDVGYSNRYGLSYCTKFVVHSLLFDRCHAWLQLAIVL